MRTKRRQPSEMGVIAIQKQMSSGAGSRKKPRDAIWTEQTLPQVAIAAISIISG